jgi:Xaa-Pro aminopeptidase
MQKMSLVLSGLLLATLLAVGCGPREPATADLALLPVVGRPEYAARRARLADGIGDGALVLPGAKMPAGDWPFFQSSDFWYLTGIEVPDAMLIVEGRSGRSTLFFTLDENTARGEGIPLELVRDPVTWTGIERVLPREDFDAELTALITRTRVLYTGFSAEELARDNGNEKRNALRRSMTADPWDGRMTREARFTERLQERFPGIEVRDATPLIWEQRRLKSPAEVALIREAARLAVEGHLAVMRSTQVGVKERELAALFEFICRRGGAAELAYYTIIMSGPNHPFGHYHRYDRVLEKGDFVILDAGPDVGYYNADVSSCFPADGRFTPRQRDLHELCAGIRQVCLATYRPGLTLREVGRAVAAWLEENGYDPGEQRFRGLVTWGGYNHPIGLATHDVMSTIRGPDLVLEPGFVFACDINMPIDETMGLRLEDTVVITADGCENLSAGLPRTVAEIEALMRGPGLLQREPPR